MDLYCKVYVHATSYEDVVQAVELATGGSEDLRTVEGSDLVVDVVPNDEHDEGRAAGGAGDFLYFPFTLDVEAAGGDETGYIAAVARLLEVLGDAGSTSSPPRISNVTFPAAVARFVRLLDDGPLRHPGRGVMARLESHSAAGPSISEHVERAGPLEIAEIEFQDPSWCSRARAGP